MTTGLALASVHMSPETVVTPRTEAVMTYPAGDHAQPPVRAISVRHPGLCKKRQLAARKEPTAGGSGDNETCSV